MIRPQNYEEVVRLKKCMELLNHIVAMDKDELLRKLYDHLALPGSSIFLTQTGSGTGELSLLSGSETREAITNISVTGRFLTAALTASSLRFTYPSSGSGSGGDSGSSGNNNNNNNNNNNA